MKPKPSKRTSSRVAKMAAKWLDMTDMEILEALQMSEKLPNLWVVRDEVANPTITDSLWSKSGKEISDYYPLALYIPAQRLRELIDRMRAQTIGYQNAVEELEALIAEEK